jgi:hypothetical protein
VDGFVQSGDWKEGRLVDDDVAYLDDQLSRQNWKVVIADDAGNN